MARLKALNRASRLLDQAREVSTPRKASASNAGMVQGSVGTNRALETPPMESFAIEPTMSKKKEFRSINRDLRAILPNDLNLE